MWRPPQWSSNSRAKVLITFPGQGDAPQYSAAVPGTSATLPKSQTIYAFDAELAIEHQQSLTKTRHPVQSGASLSDHAYMEAARLVIDVGMSDAMEAYFSPSTWSGDSSKSISAYQTMLALQFARIPLTITTRLRTYTNMLIDDLDPIDTVKTANGLRMRVVFGQIFMAEVTTVQSSARPQDTSETNLGTVNPEPPSSAEFEQNNVLSPSFTAGETALKTPVVPSTAIGAGDYSSVNTRNLSQLPGPK